MTNDGVSAGDLPKIDIAQGIKKPRRFVMELVMIALGMIFASFFWARGSSLGKSGKSITQVLKEGAGQIVGAGTSALGSGVSK